MRITDHGSWIKDPGSRSKGSRILDLVCFWYESAFQKGYRRDIKTDQIYNPRSIISYRFCKDRPWTLDLGPCFGMNGHFRRDLDVISRPPESTIDFLSVYRFKKLKQGQNGRFRRRNDFCMICYDCSCFLWDMTFLCLKIINDPMHKNKNIKNGRIRN